MTWLTVRGSSESNPVVLHGVAAVPGDKSISHRALMLGALADGTGRIEGFLPSSFPTMIHATGKRTMMQTSRTTLDFMIFLTVFNRLKIAFLFYKLLIITAKKTVIKDCFPFFVS